MTNLICAVITVLVTNWTTVSRTVPVLTPQESTYAVMRYDVINQTGLVVTNWVALIVWNGKTNEYVLESIPVSGVPIQSRSVFEAPRYKYGASLLAD